MVLECGMGRKNYMYQIMPSPGDAKGNRFSVSAPDCARRKHAKSRQTHVIRDEERPEKEKQYDLKGLLPGTMVIMIQLA